MVIQHADINGDGMFNKPELVRGIALWCVPVRLPLPSRLRKPLLSPEPPLRASGRSGEVADLQLGPAGYSVFLACCQRLQMPRQLAAIEPAQECAQQVALCGLIELYADLH